MQRRSFIKNSTYAAASGPFLGTVLGANDRIVVGQIACGARGLYELSICQRNPQVRIAAVCDVYQPLVDKARSRLDGNVDGYRDFRKIIERKDIDAVFVSTPDHWHAIAAIMACQAGKDVYCEKPLSLTIAEGRKMVEAARKYNRVVQTGSQQRSAPHFRKVVELVQSSYIGNVTVVECWNFTNEAPIGIGNPPDEVPPQGLDWDMYLGPAPKRPYNRNRFIWNYRYFWDYSGGMMTDWGAHHMDIVHWAMGVDAPEAVSASGGKFVLQDNRETPDIFQAIFEYPGFIARYAHRKANAAAPERPYGMLFHGTKGTLFVDRTGYEVVPERRPDNFAPDRDRIADLLSGAAGNPPMPRSERQQAARRASPVRFKQLSEPIKVSGIFMEPAIQEVHVQNFLDCIRSRERPVADVETGHRSVTACHLGVIAYRTGRKVRWDRKREVILDDPEAQAMTSRQYRPPWTLKV
jgi:predicted dehydrogenase